MNKRWHSIVTVIGVIVTLVSVFGAAGCSGGVVSPGMVAQEGVETAVVRRGALRVTVDVTGSLTPRSEVMLAFHSSGRVAEVLVEAGQAVEAGQPLARLEPDDLALQVAQAEATLAAAEAQLAQLSAPPRQEEVVIQEANLRAAEAQLSAAVANRDQLRTGADAGQLAAAEAQVASNTAQQKGAYDAHQRTLACRTVKLPAGTPMPDGTILEESQEKEICPALGAPEERARYALQAADASLAAAQAQLDALQTGADAEQFRVAQSNVATALAQRDAAQAQLDLLLAGAADEEIETARAPVEDARAALEQAQLRLKQATLTAPVDGTVTLLDVQAGEIVNANQPAVVLSDLSTLEVEVNLDETDVTRVEVGQTARVRLDAFPGVEITGEVTHIPSVARVESGVVFYPVTVRLTNLSTDSGEVVPARAGMVADVSVVVTGQEDVLIVPLRAVHTAESEGAYVERLVGGQRERVDVTLGLMTETEIAVTGGLAAGDEILVVHGPKAQAGLGPMGIFGRE